MDRTAIITGISGQDGSYLAEFLLNKDYEVHGIKRRTSLINTDRIDYLDFFIKNLVSRKQIILFFFTNNE